MEAERREAEADRIGGAPHVDEMRVELGLRLVQRRGHAARQFELPGGLERDRGRFRDAQPLERDRHAVLVDRLPAAGLDDTVEHGADAVRLVGGRQTGAMPEAELLVFGADAPGGLRLAALGDVVGQLLNRPDRRVVNVARIGHRDPVFLLNLNIEAGRAGAARPVRRRTQHFRSCRRQGGVAS